MAFILMCGAVGWLIGGPAGAAWGIIVGFVIALLLS